MTIRPLHILRTATITVALGLAATACGSESPETETSATPKTTDAPAATTPPLTDDTDQDVGTLVVRPERDVDLYDTPGAVEPSFRLPAATEFGTPLALLVTEVGTGDADGWARVLVPGRPNGREAWVDASELDLRAVDHEVRVDLAARTLELHHGDEVVLTTPIAIGDADHPTPTGRFSVTDKLDTGDPTGPYGPFAIGLSARSDVLTEFAGGDGQIGIHGTNDPASIGEAASHGCIRVPNEVVDVLADILPLGTPVTVS